MFIDDAKLLANAEAYAESKGIRVIRKQKLGYGSDGSVWRTSRPSAVKALHTEAKYRNELECYKRLSEANVSVLCGFHVPLLEGFADELLVIEMSIVTPPFLLDFGKVWIDQPPPYFFDPQQIANTQADARELFGRAWPDVQFVLYQLRKQFGIYYADPRPGNINCGPEFDDDEELGPEPPIDYSDYD